MDKYLVAMEFPVKGSPVKYLDIEATSVEADEHGDVVFYGPKPIVVLRVHGGRFLYAKKEVEKKDETV